MREEAGHGRRGRGAEGAEGFSGFRMDMVVDEVLVIELKVVEAFTAEHEAQILSYLRFSGKPVGLMLNFRVYPMGRNGIRRFIMQNRSSSASSV